MTSWGQPEGQAGRAALQGDAGGTQLITCYDVSKLKGVNLDRLQGGLQWEGGSLNTGSWASRHSHCSWGWCSHFWTGGLHSCAAAGLASLLLCDWPLTLLGRPPASLCNIWKSCHTLHALPAGLVAVVPAHASRSHTVKQPLLLPWVLWLGSGLHHPSSHSSYCSSQHAALELDQIWCQATPAYQAGTPVATCL
jgi:hypothetical protein